MWLYLVQMLYQNKLNKLLDYMLEFTLSVLFVKLKYMSIVQIWYLLQLRLDFCPKILDDSNFNKIVATFIQTFNCNEKNQVYLLTSCD